MSNISEHEPKFIRESHTGKICRICLAISRNSISVDNLLERTCEFVLFVKSWWFISFLVEVVIINNNIGTKTIVDVHDMFFNMILEDVGYKDLPYYHIVLSDFHFSQILSNTSFLFYNDSVFFD